MSRPAPPALTVRHDGSTRTFASGNDVVVGRDLRADIRIAHPLISRAHLVLRFDQGRWVAIDNGSLNGMYVNNRRMPSVDIHDGQRLNIGNPDGPQLTFEVGRHQGAVGRTPTMSVPISPQGAGDTSWPTQGPVHTPPSASAPPVSRPQMPPVSGSRPQSAPPGYPSGPQPQRYPSGPQPAAHSGRQPYASSPSAPAPVRQPPISQPISAPALESVTAMGPTAAPRAPEGNLATSMLKILRPGKPAAGGGVAGAIKIGRATDNDIVVPDVLASRHHATLHPHAQRNRDPGQPQHQRHVRQRSPRRLGDAARRRHRHDRQHRPGVHGRHAGPPHRDGRGHQNRRPRGARCHVDDRGQQDAAGQHLDRGAPRHIDRRYRPVRRGQVDLREVGGRLHASDDGHGGVRGSQRSRRVRLVALPNRDGAAGRRRARSADRQAGADVRRRTAVAAGHHEGRPRTGRHAGARGTRDDQASGDPGGQALRRPAQARVGRPGAVDGSVAADPR